MAPPEVHDVHRFCIAHPVAMVKPSNALVLAPSRAIMASRPRGMRRLRQESAESDTSRDSRESSDNSIQIYDPNEPEAEPEPASSGGDRRRCGAIFMLAAGMVAVSPRFPPSLRQAARQEEYPHSRISI